MTSTSQARLAVFTATGVVTVPLTVVALDWGLSAVLVFPAVMLISDEDALGDCTVQLLRSLKGDCRFPGWCLSALLVEMPERTNFKLVSVTHQFLCGVVLRDVLVKSHYVALCFLWFCLPVSW